MGSGSGGGTGAESSAGSSAGGLGGRAGSGGGVGGSVSSGSGGGVGGSVSSILRLIFVRSAITKRAFSRAISKTFSCSGVRSLRPRDLYRSDMFNLREHYYLQHVESRRHQSHEDARESRGVVVLVEDEFGWGWSWWWR